MNPFLLNGPKGFDEFTPLAENDDTFVRLDLPGVPEECVRVGLSRSKKAVIVYGEAPKVHNHDSSSRKYLTIIKTICTCCDFVGFTFQMSDGVLRLVLSKTCTDPSSCICTSTFPFLFLLFYFFFNDINFLRVFVVYYSGSCFLLRRRYKLLRYID